MIEVASEQELGDSPRFLLVLLGALRHQLVYMN
jgi:hypothetical protein